MWKKRVLAMAIAAMGLIMVAGCGSDKGAATKEQYKIGVLQLAEHPALDASNKGFVDGLAELGYKDKVVLDQQNAQGDQSNLKTISERFANGKYDMVLAIATPAAQAMANASKDVPIMATAISSFTTARLVESDEKPGGNVTGTTDMSDINKRFELIMKLKPSTKTIGTIYSSSEVNSQLQAEEFRKVAEAHGVKLVEITVSSVNDIQQAASQMASMGVDAVFFPTDNVVASSYANLVSILGDAGIPAFPSDEMLLKFGGVGSYSCDFYQLGVQTAHMAVKVLKGEAKPATMPVETQKNMKLVVNLEEAKKFGLTVPEDVLQQMAK